MCGIAGIISQKNREMELDAMLKIQHHRGPDFTGKQIAGSAFLGHNRLSIIDLHEESNQPFCSSDGRYILTFNGEIYNYIEIRKELSDYTFRTNGDTEVLLAAYIKWGKKCLDKFRGMFAFAIYDTQSNELFAARDRFGVKPFHYAFVNGEFVFASEIKAILASDIVSKKWNEKVWANYLSFAQYNMEDDTFYNKISQLEAGHTLHFKDGIIRKEKYYDFEGRLDFNQWHGKTDEEIKANIKDKLIECIELRLRADVKRGFNLSGGVDSTLLFSLIKDQLPAHSTKAFTFYCDDKGYDELDWVNQIIGDTDYEWNKCLVSLNGFEDYAKKIQWHEDEPFAGLATMAYARTFEEARKQNYLVILDGSGMDEQIGGYDYYYNQSGSLIQGTNSSPVRKHTINREFAAMADKYQYKTLFDEELLNLQYRDLFHTKLPRDLRMTDRISMAFSTEMREPFMDHELIEMCFSLPFEFKFREGQRKWLMRRIVSDYIKKPLVDAPKRPVQTPQREWLSKDLKEWVTAMAHKGIDASNWLNKSEVDKELEDFFTKDNSNSFYIWQWVSLGLLND